MTLQLKRREREGGKVGEGGMDGLERNRRIAAVPSLHAQISR